jgi:GNAT superfamily N-acetyltransferase
VGVADSIHWREDLRPGDEERVRAVVASSGFFSPAEEEIAVELVQEARARGAASGYLFLFLELGGRTVSYTCYGPIAGTQSSFDLYWIATDESQRGRGLGRAVLEATERRIAALGGRRVYAETSSRAQYAPTHRFYEGCGYRLGAELEDFYAPGDGKLVYCKVLAST